MIGLGKTLPEDHHEERIDISKFKGYEVRFGLTADNHLCSKYYRADVLNALYDIWEKQGIKTVYQCGNMVDGEMNFNRYDLCVPPGVEQQVDYFIKHWPQRKGISTKFICGDDHEGHYCRNAGIDFGKMVMYAAQKEGRKDLEYLGYMEYDKIYSAKNGQCKMRLIHAGGGSSYATSYSVQKIVESYQGGEKPNVLLVGHFHKAEYCVPTNSEILTATGWKHYNELEIGELVMGYNTKTDRCEWTALEAINVFDSATVRRHKHSSFDVWCTDNHKWALMHNKRVSNVITLGTMDDPCDPAIIQSALAPDGPGVGEINHKDFISRNDAVSLVLRMTSGERKAFIAGMMFGEGSISGSGTLVFSQMPGPVNDAFILACFLEGKSVNTRKYIDSNPCAQTSLLKNRFRLVRALKTVDSKVVPVWCPTTKLGTWVMRQGKTITITGNSYPREVHVVQAGCTEDQTPFMRKKRIQAMVGGWTISFTIDNNGIVHNFTPQFHAYYDRAFYRNWNYLWK